MEENISSHFRMLSVTVDWHRIRGCDACCGLTGNKVYPTGKGIQVKKKKEEEEEESAT
jgi:hypothetical protein